MKLFWIKFFWEDKEEVKDELLNDEELAWLPQRKERQIIQTRLMNNLENNDYEAFIIESEKED